VAVVLVVDDDADVRAGVIRELTAQGHAVRSAGTALDALRDTAAHRPDLVVLDLGLPDLDGAQVLRLLRGSSDVPIIVATARDSDAEIVRLLRAGADDYLTKPYSSEQLGARVEAVLRRTRPAQPRDVRVVGELAVDVGRHEATLAGRVLELTRREFDLLAYLAGRPDQVVTRRELLTEVWQQGFGGDKTIDVHLSWLRRKLGETAAHPRYLHTVRGVGVRLSAP
jgi:DNA-binding response OmpR family regulator